MGEISDALVERNLSRGLPFAGYVRSRPVPKHEQLKDAEWFEARVVGQSSREIGTILKVTPSPDPRFLFVKKKHGYGTIETRAVERMGGVNP